VVERGSRLTDSPSTSLILLLKMVRILLGITYSPIYSDYPQEECLGLDRTVEESRQVMDERSEREIRSLEEAVSRVVDQSRTLASGVDGGADLIEDLQQTAMALHYEIETLKVKLALGTVVVKP